MRWLHIASALFRDGGPSGIVINTGPFEHIGFAIFAIETAGALVRGVLLRRLIIQAALRARKHDRGLCYRWVLWSTAYNDQSSATAHQSPQTVFGGDYRPALRLPRFAASCHIRGRGARGLPRSGRSRFLPSAPSARARLWLLAHIVAPAPPLGPA